MRGGKVLIGTTTTTRRLFSLISGGTQGEGVGDGRGVAVFLYAITEHRFRRSYNCKRYLRWPIHSTRSSL